MYGCFNCASSMRFSTFLSDFDPNMYKEYSLEMFKERSSSSSDKSSYVIPVETKAYVPNIFESLTPIKDLSSEHSVMMYASARHLPFETIPMFYAKKFIEWSKGNSNKFENWRDSDQRRIVFPWYDRDGAIMGYSARSLDGEDPKYYRIFIAESKERFYGIDRLDDTKQVYVLEGEVDSMMIPNAVAVANGKLQQYLNTKAIYIPDADVRNPHIMKNVEKMIDSGLKVCLMPLNLPGKDLNELVCGQGWASGELIDMIHSNTYHGLQAKLRFAKWKVV